MNATSPPPVNKRPLRRALQALIILVVFVVSYFTVMAFIPPRRLLAENFPQIRKGMTFAEVKVLLGGPPGNYGKNVDGVFQSSLEGLPISEGSRNWCDDDNQFIIYFDAQSRVNYIHKTFYYRQLPGPPLGKWQQFRLWIKRQTGW